MENWKNNKLIYLASFLIILSCIALRFTGIDQYSLWQDELALYYHSQRPLDLIMSYTKNYGWHPPLFYLFYKVWLSTVEFSEVALRTYHVLMGILAAFSPLFFAKSIGRNKVTLFSLLLFCNLTLIKWSQEGLVYSTVLFLMVIFILFFDRALVKKTWGAFIFPLVLLLLINYTNYLALVIANLYVLINIFFILKDKLLVKKCVFTLISSFVAYVPWIVINHLFRLSLGLQTHSTGIIHWRESEGIGNDLWNVIIFLFNYDYFFLFFIISLCLISIKKKFLSIRKSNQKVIALITIIYFILITLAHLKGLSLLLDRYFLILVPLMLYSVSNIIESYKKETQMMIVAVIVIMNLIPFNSYSTFLGSQDFRAPLTKLGSKDSSTRPNLILFIYNPNWLVGYINKYQLDKKYRLIGSRGDCQNTEMIEQHLKEFKRGDVILLTHTVCENDFLIEKMYDLDLKYTRLNYSDVELLFIN